MKYVALTLVTLLCGCNQNTFSQAQANAIQNACTANGGVISKTYTTVVGVPYNIHCSASAPK